MGYGKLSLENCEFCNLAWKIIVYLSVCIAWRTDYPKFILLWNSTCFGHLLCPSSGIFYCTFGTGKLHAGFWWPFPSTVRMECHYPNLFSYETLHVSGIFFVHYQEFSTVRSALASYMQVSDDRFQAESEWNCSSILTLLGNGHQTPACNLPVPNVQ